MMIIREDLLSTFWIVILDNVRLVVSKNDCLPVSKDIRLGRSNDNNKQKITW